MAKQPRDFNLLVKRGNRGISKSGSENRSLLSHPSRQAGRVLVYKPRDHVNVNSDLSANFFMISSCTILSG